jgi:hypothetical protein
MIYNDCNGFCYKNISNPKKGDLFVPLNIDTEFYTPEFGSSKYRINPSSTLTIQMRSIDDAIGKIYNHSDNADIARYPIVTVDFAPIRYLEDYGFNLKFDGIRYQAHEVKNLPMMRFDLYAHFACADFIRIFKNQLLQSIRDNIIFSKNRGNGISQERRLRSHTKYGKLILPYIFLPFIIHYENRSYQLAIEIRDSIGIAGNCSYFDLGKLTNVDLPYKNLLSKDDLANMKNTYLQKQNDYDLYSLGDLKVTDMITGFNKLYKKLLNDLCFPEKNCKLTIGSSVAQILEIALIKYCGGKETFELLTKKANPKYIIENYKTTRLIMCKVDGGRCFNNRPTITTVKKEKLTTLENLILNKSALVDIDISSAYGSGLLHQHYPLGNPKSFNHNLDTNNKYLTLREFLKRYGDELKPRLWTMRVSTIDYLKYSQDLISSWIISFEKLNYYFTNNDEDDLLDTKEGYVKVFENEIILGTITSDILDWIDNICSQRQRKELYDNLVIINAFWYDKNQEVNTVKEVIEANKIHESTTTSEYEENRLNTIEEQSHKWCSVSIGDLFLKQTLLKRDEYKKKDKDGAEDLFYKLVNNTVYGVLVSKYFDVGNLVVGNNITAKCRTMSWYMEKGLNAYQTITDGCTFELDNVNYPVNNRNLYAHNLVRTYNKKSEDNHVCQKPLEINKYVKTSKEGLINIKSIAKVATQEIIDKGIEIYGESFKDKIKYTKEGITFDKETFITLFDMVTENNKYDDLDTNYTYDLGLDIMDHLRNLFPNVSLLHEIVEDINGNPQKGHFKLEVKAIADEAVFHGNADYSLKNTHTISKPEKPTITVELIPNPPDKKDIYRMRGYRESQCYLINETDDNEVGFIEQTLQETPFLEPLETLETISGINVPKEFLDTLLAHSRAFPRFDVFLQEKIIKASDYKQSYKTLYQHTNLEIGHTFPQARLLSEITLGQFLFRTHNQYEKWMKHQHKAKNNQGQGLEANYINQDGNLDYQKAVEDIANKITNEKTPKVVSKNHPHFEKLEAQKNEIENSLWKKED